jgi:hypothetical protein
MDTIEEYKIIESPDLGSLTTAVNVALSEGWQPHGAPLIQGRGTARVGYCWQAMVNFHQPTGEETIGRV